MVSPVKWNVPLTAFKDVPRSDKTTGHIILSGPSVNKIDYDQLDLPVLMGVNGAIALCQRFDLKFDYYTIIDDSFIRCRQALAEEIIAQDLTLFVRANVLRAIAHHLNPNSIKCRIVVFDEVDTPTCRAKPSENDLYEKARSESKFQVFDAKRYQGFSADPRLGLFGARTVAYDALQLMVWLNINKIYFHGLDMNNTNTTPRFYETKETAIGTTLDKNFESTIEPSFRAAGEYLRKQGVTVYNLSLDSALDENVFPKLSWKVLTKGEVLR
jgi:Kdo-III transferase WaaZ